MTDPFGSRPLPEVAEEFGTPMMQLQRWAASGAFPSAEVNEHRQVIATYWTGNIRIPRRMMVTPDGLAFLRDVVIPSAAQPHQHAA